jgi:hypothetical protein
MVMQDPLSRGQVIDGYRFKGGDPNQESSWEQVAPIDVSSQYGAGARQLPNGVIERVGPRGGVQRIGSAGGGQGGGSQSAALVGADSRARFMTGLGPLRDAQNNFAALERGGNPLDRDWGAAIVDEYTNIPGLRNIGDAVARRLGGEDYQQYTQARSTYESSLLPILSGAAVTPSEAERLIRADLPQIGDTPEVLARKARNRSQRINAVAEGIGQPAPFPLDQAAAGSIAPGSSAQTAIDYTDPSNRAALADLVATGGWIRDGAGDPYQVAPGGIQVARPQEGDEQAASGIYVRNSETPEGALAQREETPDWWRRIDGFIRGVADTSSIGFADEAAAGADALIGRGVGDDFDARYQNNLQVQRAIDRSDSRDIPVTRFLGQAVGGVVAPGASLAGRFVAAAPTIAGALARGAGTGAAFGAAYGAGNAEEGSRLDGARAGAVAGGLTGGALGVGGRVIGRGLNGRGGGRGGSTPSDPDTLAANGVFVTPGARRGGLAKSVEDLAQRAPILGSAVRGARQRSVESLNRAVGNRALASIGEGLPANVKSGAEATDYVARRLGQEFDRAADMVPAVGIDDRFLQNSAQIAQGINDLPQSKAQQFQNILKDRLSRLTGDAVTGRQLRTVESELNTLSARFEGSQDASDQLLGSMLGDVASELQDLLARANPEAGAILSKVKPGYRDYVVMRRASQAAGGNVFSPSQLLTAVRAEDSTVGNGATARGSAPLQDLARAARNVIPDGYGNPGTADALGYGALGTLTLSNPVAGAVSAGGLSAAATPYMLMGRKLIETLPANPSPQQVNTAVRRLTALAQRDPNVTSLIEYVRNASQVAIPGAAAAMAAQ